jgi:SAM-dependent methyltransferase
VSAPVRFDAAAESYDRVRAGLARGRATAADVAPLLVPGPVLDIGAGAGAVAAGIRELGYRVAALDLSVPMLSQARERVGGAAVLGDARALPVASASVADVLLVHVLHVAGDMARVIAEAARVLRPGGRLIALHGEPVAAPGDIIDAIAPLSALAPRRPDGPADLAAAGRDAGLALAEQRLTRGYEQGITPAAMAEIVIGRQFSYLMHIDARTWEITVKPVISALRALPDQARPRRHVWQTHLTALAKGPGPRLASRLVSWYTGL